MDNIILSGMLQEFANRYELQSEKQDLQFEKFSNYCLWKADHYDSFEFSKVETGTCIGVDGVAITIGGVIVNDLDDAKALTQGNFDARFLFSQAKTSSHFDSGEFLKFIGTVKLFFEKNRNAVPEQLRNAFDIKEHIYSRASKLRSLPQVALSYVYAGKYALDKNTAAPVIEAQATSIRDLPYLFSDVSWRVYDGDAIARLYREAQNETQREISFQRHVALPPIKGSRAAYIGVVKCIDYVNLVEKESGELNKGLFFENVRDYLGDSNSVNEEIAKTIRTEDERNRFAILNNGVTIVAKSVTPSGDFFKLSGFQVVNGCQTSHVLYNNKSLLSDDMYITVKLIETSDIDLSGKVIATTNSQSQVTKEALATIRPYHRNIEDFFNAMRSSGYKYRYERRPHQFDGMAGIFQSNIVSAPLLIKSFISVALEEPHKVHYYYGTLLQEYNKDQASELFATHDYPGMYFAAHHICARVKAASGKYAWMSNWIYHTALLIKKQIAPDLRKGSEVNDRKFLELLGRIDEEFDSAYEIARRLIQAENLARNDNRVPDVTKKLLSKVRAASQQKRSETAGESTRTPPTLSDGNYVGIVDESAFSPSSFNVRYGPFILQVKNTSKNEPAVGKRILFNMKNGLAEWDSKQEELSAP